MFVDREYCRRRSLRRKLNQASWAIRRELKGRKVDILDEYLSSVYWGRDFYGLDAACSGYLGRGRLSLSVADSLFLVAKIASPNTDPTKRITLLLQRPAVNRLISSDAKSLDELRQRCKGQKLSARS
jgi:membrane peptidoglycan carboxypeptidase